MAEPVADGPDARQAVNALRNLIDSGFGEILEAGVDACPPLMIFLLAACLLMDRGCLSNLVGVLLIIVGIIAFIVWLLI